MATTTQWTGSDGNWTDLTWTDGVPESTTDAIIDGISADPLTVTFNTPSGAALSLGMQYATLDVAAGTLSLETASLLDALTQSGGALDFLAGGTINGPLSQTAGMLENDSGTLTLSRGGSFAGALSGAGEIVFAAGAVTLASGLALSVGTLVVADTTALAGDTSDTGVFTLAASGTLDLAGHDFTAEHRVALSGVVEGPGALVLRNSGDVNGLTARGTLAIDDDGVVRSDGLLTLGASAADRVTFAIQRNDTYTLTRGSGIAANGDALIENSGGLEDTATSGTISIAGNVDNSDAISIDSGTFHNVVTDTLLFTSGTFTNTGDVVAGFGNIVFGPGVIDANLVDGTLTGGLWEPINGTLAITGGPIVTDAATIILDGAQPLGAAGGAPMLAAGDGTTFTPLQQSLSTIAINGVLEVIGTSSYVTRRNVVDNGFIDLAGTADRFGTLYISATGQLDETGTLAADNIRSAGTVVVGAPFPTATVAIAAPFASIGTLVIDSNDELVLAGTDNLLEGKIFGAGTLALGPGTSTRFGRLSHGSSVDDTVVDAGATLTLGASLADTGAFAALGGSTLDLGGHDLTLDSTSSLSGAPGATVLVDNGGVLANAGNMDLSEATFTTGTVLANRGTITQTLQITLGDASGGTGSLVNLAAGTYDMVGGATISAAGAIRNSGLFEKTGPDTATIGAAFTNAGTIGVTAGTLEITAAFTNTGTIIGTETESGGITYITAPSPALFNQYAADTSAAGGANLALPPLTQSATAALANPQAA